MWTISLTTHQSNPSAQKEDMDYLLHAKLNKKCDLIYIFNVMCISAPRSLGVPH